MNEIDVAVVGSGFGGSVSALRLAERGLSVAVLEQGGRVDEAWMRRSDDSLSDLLWMPAIRMFGYFAQHVFRHVGIVGGVGVGGGSLVYAAVLLRPPAKAFANEGWSRLGLDWQRELSAHYAEAERMLGVADNPGRGPMDEWLEEVAERRGRGESFGPTPNGIFFGEPGVEVADPFHGGEGPRRSGCNFCGRCLTGCPNDAKNSLDRNYLYLAERKGAEIRPWHAVTSIAPREGGGYVLESEDRRTGERHPPLHAERVILSAGVVGTLDLLFRCRDVLGTLPEISSELGRVVRTNSESIVGAYHREPPEDLLEGAAISSHFYPTSDTHVTQNRFPPGYGFMRYYAMPMVDAKSAVGRALGAIARSFRRSVRKLAPGQRWNEKVSVLTVMQKIDSELSFHYPRRLVRLGRRALSTRLLDGQSAPPARLPIANELARELAEVSGGDPFELVPSSVMGMSITAHILGGAAMGRDATEGVIDRDHQVFGHPGLYVIDGAAVPSNIGVNPSLTITALAERAARRVAECALEGS